MKYAVHVLKIVPMLLVMGTIFFLSHQPGAKLPLPGWFGFDKLLHMAAYAVLAAAMAYALPRRYLSSRPGRAGILIVLFCFLYGLSDEFHQSFIPGRQPSLGDLAADTIGALLFIWARPDAGKQKTQDR